MPVTIRMKNDTLVAGLRGEIDHHASPQLREAIDEAIFQHENAVCVELDFSEVTFMDSSGVGLVMGRYRLLSTLGKKLVVTGLSERDYRIMKMSGLSKLATLTPASPKENVT